MTRRRKDIIDKRKTYTEKELMQMAIDVMNKSINEPRADGKVPPKVGAIGELDNQELAYFELFRSKKAYSKSEFVEQTGLATRTAERMLKRWVNLKLLKKEGGGKYFLNILSMNSRSPLGRRFGDQELF